MRFSLRIALLTLSATLALGVAGVAAAGQGAGKWGKVAGAKHGSGQSAAAQGGGTASQGGQGAATNHGGCEIIGLPSSVQGTGNVVANPNGTNYGCHGELPAGETPPDRPVKVETGDCVTQVTPSGQVKTTCHSKNP
jgi:hypothetical protein